MKKAKLFGFGAVAMASALLLGAAVAKQMTQAQKKEIQQRVRKLQRLR